MTNTNPFLDRLTPDNAAVILIDHQVKLMLGVQTLDPHSLKNNTLGLAKVAAIFKLPTILTGGSPDDPLMPELKAAVPDHEYVQRNTINSWDTPAFVEAVEKTGRKKLIMAGITTDLCLLFPAISAVAAGYAVYVVVDACGCFTPMIEQAALLRLTQAGVIPATWGAVAAELQRDIWTEGNGPAVMQTYVEHSGPISLIAATRTKH